MRFIGTNHALWTTHTPFVGDGVALYVSPAGVDDPTAINYRNLRMLPQGVGVIFDGFPAAGDGPFGLDAHVAIAAAGDALDWSLPDEYLSSVFWANVRPHRHGLEGDILSGWQRIVTASDGTPLDSLGGGQIVRLTKLDAGGVRVWFVYLPSVTGTDPVSFRVSALLSSSEVVGSDIAFSKPRRDYYVDLPGLADGVTYTIRLLAVGAISNQILDTKPFTADALGPADVLTITATEA